MNLPHNYDDRRLSGPDDIHQPYVGTEEGDTCNRIAEPDEDAPRGYRPRPCGGLMVSDDDPQWPGISCDTCGEIAE